MRETLAQWFWQGRTRRGRTAVILGSILILLLAIGLEALVLEDEEPSRADTDTTRVANTTERATNATTSEQSTPSHRATSVFDGDTIKLDNGDRVRLVQIDAPEYVGECYGRQASTVLRQLLPLGTRVRLVRDPKLDDVDRFGRLLRYVFKGNENINLVLVEKGAANGWFFDGRKGRYATELIRAENRARAAGCGLWGACEGG